MLTMASSQFMAVLYHATVDESTYRFNSTCNWNRTLNVKIKLMLTMASPPFTGVTYNTNVAETRYRFCINWNKQEMH